MFFVGGHRRPGLSVARGMSNVRPDYLASASSRSHASLSINHGKLVLTDQSSNGTYVRFKGQEGLFLCRESLPLLGDGYISLGEAINELSPTIISFSILQTG